MKACKASKKMKARKARKKFRCSYFIIHLVNTIFEVYESLPVIKHAHDFPGRFNFSLEYLDQFFFRIFC